ncbi:MAG TPA: response regulator [Deinococcales bacterium]|nr:response regulator [Deinococcales bacterium]
MKTILVVDDNATNLKLMSLALAARGHNAIQAASGEEALQAIREQRPHLVLLDVQMPGMSGKEVAAAVRAEDSLSGTRLVAVTALAMRGDREDLIASGFDDYLAKPYRMADLHALVERWVGDTA